MGSYLRWPGCWSRRIVVSRPVTLVHSFGFDVPTIAYFANQFPSLVEPYVVDEIEELRKHGVNVIPCSARQIAISGGTLDAIAAETLYLQPLRFGLMLHAAVLCLAKFPLLKDLYLRILFQGREPLSRRLRAILHTWLGVYYALLLEGKSVEHIHVHHGYFGSWIAMVAARGLGITFSMTLHGSDVLLHAAYLDTKLKNCSFCVTVSEFNRRHLLEQYPEVSLRKIVVHHLGVDPGKDSPAALRLTRTDTRFLIVSVGRLHPVKDHAFLVRACHTLKSRRIPFDCVIAGEGPERRRLERLIRDCDLEREVHLLGHLSSFELSHLYARSDVVVLTSHSEGIPLVLMEAMLRGKPVLAPSITGIPELVLDGETGFLYHAGSQEDFVAHVELIFHSLSALGPLCRAARQHVLEHFYRGKNLAAFCDFLLVQLHPARESQPHENPLLQ